MKLTITVIIRRETHMGSVLWARIRMLMRAAFMLAHLPSALEPQSPHLPTGTHPLITSLQASS